MNTHFITSFCSIRNGKVNHNHSISTIQTDVANTDFSDFLKHAYHQYELNYPKFYKMDNLCKLGFLTASLLLKNNNTGNHYPADAIATVLSNQSSSLDSDEVHQHSISKKENYFPSPATFVYTLPNILIAEIAIKFGFKGENAFFIHENFDAPFMKNYADLLLYSEKASCCLCGWVDYYKEGYHSFMYIVEKQKGILGLEHTSETLEKLFLQQLN